MKTIGARIRELRELKGLSLRDFGKRLGGLSAAFLSDVELGRRYPSDTVLSEMARVLATSIEDLRQYDTRPPIDELRRLSTSDPAFALAFRELFDQNITSDELMKFVAKRRPKSKERK